MKVKKEHSAGGPVFKRIKIQDSGFKILWLLGKHSGYHKWVLPKGMIEKGETPEETAIRETEEELAVVARIVEPEPVYEDHYSYKARFKIQDSGFKNQEAKQPIRRVATYQETEDFKTDEQTYLVDKTVTFYLMEYVSGDPQDHGWEMEAAGWFSLGEAKEMLSFEGEKIALQKAVELLASKSDETV